MLPHKATESRLARWSCQVNGTAATDATIAALKAAFDGEVKVDYSPTSFAGLKLERDRERRTLTLSMPQKIIEAAREHMPELLRGERPTLLSGRRLAVAADSLKLADRDGKLTPQQVRTQSIIGHLKFVERGVRVRRVRHVLLSRTESRSRGAAIGELRSDLASSPSLRLT